MSIPFRLAAIDLDGTLLGPDKQISPANRAAVRDLQNAGVRVVLASGRRHENMTRFHQSLGLEGPMVSAQGALVKEVETGAVLHQRYVPADLAVEVVRHGLEEGMSLIYYLDEGIHMSGFDRHTRLYQSRGGDELIDSGKMEHLAGRSPQKIIWLESPERIASTFPSVEARYQGRSDTLVSDPEYLEFMAYGISKAVGLAVVAERYGIDSSEVLSFGDANNDVTMLQWTGLGVAMSQSTPAAKAAANRVAPAGDPENSFARAVAEILA